MASSLWGRGFFIAENHMRQPDNAFADFAAIYQQIDLARASREQAHTALTWLRERGAHVQRALDLACGTGEAAQILAETGMRVFACDASAAMLALAKAHPNIRYQQGDICELIELNPPDAEYDLVTCFGTGFNYLVGDYDLQDVLQDSADLLRDHGYILFDLIPSAEFELWQPRDRVLYDDGEDLVYQNLEYDSDTLLASARTVWFCHSGERWQRGEETHSLRAWHNEDVFEALDEASLQLLARIERDGAHPLFVVQKRASR
jgi:SAM-dependent methyltransferase